MRQIRAALVVSIVVGVLSTAVASTVIPLPTTELVNASDAIFRGTVMGSVCFKDSAGMIWTRTFLQVDEALKGKFPAGVQLVHRGGALDGSGFTDDSSPHFQPGVVYLVFVKRRSDGTLFATQGIPSAVKLGPAGSGDVALSHQNLLDEIRTRMNSLEGTGADVTDQAVDASLFESVWAPSGDAGGSSTNGLLADTNGVPSRFSRPDSGQGIPYLVDADALPAGITIPQALNAVSNAFQAWAAASSFRFSFMGTQGFGAASPTINANDGFFHIQLHDTYGYIGSPNVLGIGGSAFSVGLLANANWGPGGRVSGMEFNTGRRGFVVLNHTNTTMQTLSSFTEVLTHEIGHVIGLAHSSEDPGETTNLLKQSVMYYIIHADGRGASLNSYDTNVVREVHPLDTPPFTFDRFLDVTTSPFGTPNVAGINEVEFRGYDLQTTNLTLYLTNDAFLNGSFSWVGNKARFTPSGYYGFTFRYSPAENGYKGLVFARVSDGTNASGYVLIRVLSFHPDTTSPSDGIPDDWMARYFGHTDPQVGDKSQSTDDADKDGLNNLREYIAAANPTNIASAQRILSLSNGTLRFQAKAYELYEVLGSTNLANWIRIGVPFIPTNAPAQILTDEFQTNVSVAISNLATDNPQMFFRILKVP